MSNQLETLTTLKKLDLTKNKDKIVILTTLFDTNESICETLITGDLLHKEEPEGVYRPVNAQPVYNLPENLKNLIVNNFPIPKNNTFEYGNRCKALEKALFTKQLSKLENFYVENWVILPEMFSSFIPTGFKNCVIHPVFLNVVLMNCFLQNCNSPTFFMCRSLIDDDKTYMKNMEIIDLLKIYYTKLKMYEKKVKLFNMLIKNKDSSEIELYHTIALNNEKQKLDNFYNQLQFKFTNPII